MTANKLELKNRLKRGFTMVEVVVAMAVIGVMIALAVAASVIGVKGQTNAQNRIKASSAAGEMYAAFSRVYYNDGFYDSNTYTAKDDTTANAFLSAYNGEIAAGLNLSANPSITVSSGLLSADYTQNIDTITYYQYNSTDNKAEEKICVTRGFTIANGGSAYKFTYTYFVNSLEFDEDDFTYTESSAFTVTAEVDLTSGYSVTVTAKTSDSSKNVFKEEYSFA